jgi:hypothetical protein
MYIFVQGPSEVLMIVTHRRVACLDLYWIRIVIIECTVCVNEVRSRVPHANYAMVRTCLCAAVLISRSKSNLFAHS